MAFANWLARLHFWRRGADRRTGDHSVEFEVIIRAHGDWLAFLGTVLEREHVITADELARSLAEFAVITGEDRPAEGRILSFWSAYLQDTNVALRDLPSLH